MELESRFIARGNAVAFAGFIVDFKEKSINSVVPVTNCSCSLPVSGGASESTQREYAYPSAEDAAVSLTAGYTRAWHEVRGDTQVTRTKAEIKGLTIGQSPKLSVESAVVEMRSEHANEGRVPSIDLLLPRSLDLKLDDSTLRVTFSAELAGKYRTQDELRRAYEQDDDFYKRLHGCFVSSPAASGQRRRLAEYKGYIPLCLVEKMGWVGEPHPDVRGGGLAVEGHVIRWKGLGTIYLGEMLVSEFSRRFTLIRTRLGSPLSGDVSACEVESNGQRFP